MELWVDFQFMDGATKEDEYVVIVLSFRRSESITVDRIIVVEVALVDRLKNQREHLRCGAIIAALSFAEASTEWEAVLARLEIHYSGGSSSKVWNNGCRG
jgi:hypothetical protein